MVRGQEMLACMRVFVRAMDTIHDAFLFKFVLGKRAYTAHARARHWIQLRIRMCAAFVLNAFNMLFKQSLGSSGYENK